MNISDATRSFRGATGLSASSPKLTKACVRCHSRKLKCDAVLVGLPCSRCSDKGYPEDCVQTRRLQRKKPGPKPKLRHISNPGSRLSTTNSGETGAKSQDQSTIECQNQTPFPDPATESSRDDFVSEIEARVQVCRELAMGHGVPSPDKILETVPGRDVVEYHNGTDYLSILGQTLSRDERRRVTRIVVDDEVIYTGVVHPSQSLHEPSIEVELLGLDAADRDYLTKKGVFALPPRDCIETYLKCYFEMVHPYAPVLNRVDFMNSYYTGRHSPFLMQAIFAIGALYAPNETLLASGFTDREAAQASFFKKAALLYDFRCERSQLRLLQGSLILSSTILSYSLDKDYRYWFLNGVRLAVKMGLHRNDVIHDMNPETYRLCKRIWWVLYSRDVLFSFTGHQNMRMLTNNICDTTLLTEDEWDDEIIPPQYEKILSPVSMAQKQYFIANCKLAVIGSKCLSTFRFQKDRCADEVGSQFESWRLSIPKTMQMKDSQEASEHIWYTQLLATSYRFECVLYRLLRIWWQDKDAAQHAWTKKRLTASMFELETVIGRVVARNALQKFPLAFNGCIPTILALYIESALDTSETQMTRSMSQLRIPQTMLLLRQLEHFPTIQRAILVFEWVLSQKDLRYIKDCSIISASTSGVEQSKALLEDGVVRNEEDNAASQGADMPIESGQWFEEFIGFDFLDNLELLE